MDQQEPFEPLRTLIIEPDVVFLRELKAMVDDNPNLTLSQACRTGRAAMNYLRSEKVDLILLNPALPDKNGFDLIVSLPDVPPTLVFADRTDYAYYAFRIGAFDFRSKPVSVAQFRQSLERVFRAVRQDREVKRLREAVKHQASAQNPLP